MKEKRVGELCKLPKRLEAVLSMLNPGCRLLDVGCDHGYTGITAVQRKIAVSALLTDINPGPLSSAAENAAKADPSGTRIRVRLSDGLSEVSAGEADTLILSGMGGPLIQKILTAEREKTASFRTLILSPQSLIPEFRRFLKEEGIRILDEAFVFEDGKYYVIIKATPEGEKRKDGIMSTDTIPEELAEEFGPVLLQRKDPVLKQFLYERSEKCDIILCKLEAEAAAPNAKEAAKLQERQKELIRKALAFYE